MSVASADEFWTFSSTTYGKSGVQAACLALQDRLGADINLLLFCLWWSLSGGPALDTDCFAAVLTKARGWQDGVVRPIRAARRTAKPGGAIGEDEGATAFYQRVLATELEAERMEQKLIVSTAAAEASKLPARLSTIEAVLRIHLAQYVATLDTPVRQEDRADLETIIAAGCQGLSAAGIVEAIWP
ncbi:TIGR02444 family protein [Lichenifustis flavocetrariae]|uniref:TIGR02444 family protein n=1 Tax=Lichenifustis flavocetrariae TaxID=2949735 RepID=A0AA41YVD8_9HYPH|nr:TIGR02444 family protein [Lichenifustis flavocetrariae]MCW6507822.1 TIGR02444 family protein [Lichenifustis flavocetrariae]